MSIETKEIGKEGERLALKYLEDNGFKIVARNYRFGKGEIDIIAEDTGDNFLVFVEVKTRLSLGYGAPEYAITKQKIKQIKKVAELYLYEKKIREKECRFDVIAIVLSNNEKPILTHYKNAFM